MVKVLVGQMMTVSTLILRRGRGSLEALMPKTPVV